jgi:hypothetical protein
MRLLSAHIGRQLGLQEAELTNIGARALVADRMQIDGSMGCKSLKAEGEMRLVSAQISGQLVFREAELLNPHSRALDLERARVGHLILSTKFAPVGIVDLADARVSRIDAAGLRSDTRRS